MDKYVIGICYGHNATVAVAKNGEIIIQGNVREKVMEILKKEGYNYKRVGG